MLPFCRTKKNGPPILEDKHQCGEWLHLELSLMEIPEFIVLMGNDALRMFMGDDYPGVQRIYGELYKVNFKGKDVLLIPVYHPFLVRNPEEAENTFNLLEEVSRNNKEPKSL